MDEKLSILLVEDDPATRSVLRILLAQAARQAAITEAANGEEAMAALARARFDVVVSDFHMGGLDGIGLLARARDEQPRAGRILVTGHADFEVAREAINRAGVHAFLQKPVTLAVLERALATARDRVMHETPFGA